MSADGREGSRRAAPMMRMMMPARAAGSRVHGAFAAYARRAATRAPITVAAPAARVSRIRALLEWTGMRMRPHAHMAD